MRVCEFCRCSTNDEATFLHGFEECDQCFWESGERCDDPCEVCEEHDEKLKKAATSAVMSKVDDLISALKK